MGQFDYPSAAALAQLKNDALSSSRAGEIASHVAGIGGKILELAGYAGATSLTDLVQELKGLAASKDEANLIYFAEAVVDDMRRLYRLNEEMRRQAEASLSSTEFHQAVANATLHITRTNVEARLKRVAALIVSGVKNRDLEPDSLDDMMRIAVELTDWDIFVLGKMYDSQKGLLSGDRMSFEWTEQVGHLWESWANIFGVGERDHIRLRSSLSRLQSAGLIAEAQTNFVKDGSLARQPFGLLIEGKKFYERLQEIGPTR